MFERSGESADHRLIIVEEGASSAGLSSHKEGLPLVEDVPIDPSSIEGKRTSFADSLADRLVEGGHRRDEVERDVRVARETLRWVRAAHPGWIAAESTSRIIDSGTRDDIAEFRLASRGAAYCIAARGAVESYDELHCSRQLGIVGCILRIELGEGVDGYPHMRSDSDRVKLVELVLDAERRLGNALFL